MALQMCNQVMSQCRIAQRLAVRCMSANSDRSQNPTVYIGKISPRIRRARIISISSSVGTTIIAPLIAAKKFHLSALWMAVASGTPMTLTYMYTAVVFFMTRTYVTEMFLKNPDTLVVKKYNVFCQQVTQEIDPKEIEVPVNVGLLESFRVKNESYLIDDNSITDRDLYECISGFRNREVREVTE